MCAACGLIGRGTSWPASFADGAETRPSGADAYKTAWEHYKAAQERPKSRFVAVGVDAPRRVSPSIVSSSHSENL